jgi:hypothetical protein
MGGGGGGGGGDGRSCRCHARYLRVRSAVGLLQFRTQHPDKRNSGAASCLLFVILKFCLSCNALSLVFTCTLAMGWLAVGSYAIQA